MLLDLTRIRSPHEHVDRAYKPEAFKPDEDYKVVDPVRLSLDVDKDKETFRLTGRVETVIELQCSRCLEPFRWTVDEPFELTYQPRATIAFDAEREIADEDFSAAYYEHEQIDLEQLVRERIEMSMPMKPLCSDQCKGLCAICGTNLNRGTCNCRRDWDDPRFAALKKLKADS